MKAIQYATALAIICIGGAHLEAQVSESAGYGGIGDPATASGDPSSSYALGGIDHLNYYNGSVNITIPVLSIGGRGTVARNIAIPVQRQWTVSDVSGSYVPSTGDWPIQAGLYTSGYMSIETASQNAYACQVNGSTVGNLGPLTTYLVWTNFDGTQTILTDTKYAGQPQDSTLTSCSQLSTYSYADRGRVFRSTDGTDLTFYANADVYDNTTGLPAGTLVTRDGTKYTFTPDSYVQQIEDRNGNQITFSFQSTANGGIYTVNDPANRQSTINFTESLPTDTQDVLTYPGYNGSSHQIKVTYALLGNALASGESLQTYHCLFPELNGASSSTQFNNYVISQVTLPDGTSYTLQYNSYGELARLVLPTGAFYVYKYAEAACNANGNSGVITLASSSGYNILRRLEERDEYANGGALSAKIVFSAQAGNSDGQHSARPTTAVTVNFEDSSSNNLRQEVHYFYGNPASSAANPATPTQYADWWLGLEFQSTVGSSSQVNRFSQNVYQQRPWAQGENPWFSVTADAEPSHDPQLCQTDTSLESGQSSGLIFGYDQYNNQTDKYEYDYGTAPAIGASCPSPDPGNYLRHTNVQYLTGNYLAQSVNILNLPQYTYIYAGGGGLVAETRDDYDEEPIANAPNIVGHDNQNYAGGVLRGNVTNHNVCLSVNSSGCATWAGHGFWYDIAGNVVKTTDANNNITNYSYNDAYSDGEGRSTYARMTSVTNALNQKTTYAYDYNTGKATSQIDPNNVTTVWAYNDPLDRLTVLRRAAYGDSHTESDTQYFYQSPTQVMVEQDQYTTGDAQLKSQTIYDGLGRPLEQNDFESSSTYIQTTQTYDALGRVITTTNPSRMTNGSGDGLNYATIYSYDALGRTIQVMTTDGAAAKTAYWGNQTIATDQAGKERATYSDALGRVTQVVEDPQGLNYTTNYGYDALNDLTSVAQGSETRSFSYDPRGLLLAAVNPESGTVGYSYDAVGNVTARKDNRGISTSYSYDALNRLTAKSYSDSTPGVSYAYDQEGAAAHAIGQLTQVTNSYSTASYTSFDLLGNVLASTQQDLGQNYNFSYGYNLAGGLSSETYPSGRVVTNSFDGRNRTYATTGSYAGNQTNYVTGTSYWPQGTACVRQYGNQLASVMQYNSRLQPGPMYAALNNNTNQMYWVENVTYGNGGTTNNGTISASAIGYGTASAYSALTWLYQSYSYDSLNRLSASYDNGWSRSYGYDRYGNLWLAGNSGGALNGATPTSNVFSAANQITGTSYDAAGNQLSVNGNTTAYDAENRQTSATESASLGGATESYGYDGNGLRTQKSGPNGVVSYVYDAFGQLAAEYTTAAQTGPPCTTCYLSYDHLGTVRLVTDQNANVIGRHDYLPFGEEIPAGTAGRTAQWGAGNDNVITKFTGQVRDAETGADYFNARYFTGPQGRFTSPDPANAGADILNPQSWNAYAYVGNNPLVNVDPTGTHLVDCDWDECGIPGPVGGGGGGGGGAVIDGLQQSVFNSSGLGSNGLAPCPLGGCSGFGSNGAYFQFSADAGGNTFSNQFSRALELNCTGESTDNYQCAWSHWSSWLVQGGDQTKYFGNVQQLFNANQQLWKNTAWVGNALGAATAALVAAPIAIDVMASLPTMQVGIGASGFGTPLHVVYGTAEGFQQGIMYGGEMVVVGGAFAARTFANSPIQLSLPILNAGAVLTEEGTAVTNCVTAGVCAFGRGWLR